MRDIDAEVITEEISEINRTLEWALGAGPIQKIASALERIANALERISPPEEL